MRILVLCLLTTVSLAQDPTPAPKGAVTLFDGANGDSWVHRNSG